MQQQTETSIQFVGLLLLCGSEQSKHTNPACKRVICCDTCEMVCAPGELWCICSISKPFAHFGFKNTASIKQQVEGT